MKIDGNAYNLSFQGFSVYVIGDPEEGTISHQEDYSLERPSKELKLVSDHILNQLAKLGGVTQVSTPGVWPVLYTISEPDGSTWQLAIPIQEPPRRYDQIYGFMLPK